MSILLIIIFWSYSIFIVTVSGCPSTCTSCTG